MSLHLLGRDGAALWKTERFFNINYTSSDPKKVAFLFEN